MDSHQSMTSSEMDYVISIRVQDPDSPPVPGSTIVPCRNCHRDVWLSEGTRLTIEGMDLPPKVVCAQCMLLMTKAQDN